MAALTLAEAEIAELCPDITQPAARVRRLHDEGFSRARLCDGKVILERAHYEAVCRGEFGADSKKVHNSPRLKMSAVNS
jgi:hypothetical protein